MSESTTSTDEYLANRRYGETKREMARIKVQRSQLIRDREYDKRVRLQAEIKSMYPANTRFAAETESMISRIKGALKWGIKS